MEYKEEEEKRIKQYDYIQEQKPEEIKELYVEQNSVANYVSDFLDGICKNVDTPAISTGFPELDSILEGGLYEGLYVVGAISSLGKTTFVLQIADQIAQQGEDVLIFSLEMSRYELMAKSISRLTYLNCNGKEVLAKTNRGITAGARWKHYSKEELTLMTQSISDYKKDSTHLYIYEGIGDIGVEEIKKTVETHISITGKKPIVIIDYLQILAPHEIRATDKQNTDKAVLELKRLSRDYKIPVIGISSLNRQNYNSPISMEAFKESGAIEYSSDVLIGLQPMGVDGKDFDVNEAKRSNPRKIEVVILKNRNGCTGDKLLYEYYAMFNYFCEKGKIMSRYDDKLKTVESKQDGFEDIVDVVSYIGKKGKKK